MKTAKIVASVAFIATFIVLLGYTLSSHPSPEAYILVGVAYRIEHPTDVTKLGEGETWYCQEHHCLEYWNGTRIIALKG